MRRIEAAAPPAVTITFQGRPVPARPGETVAAALLAAGESVFRETPVTGAPRGPHCMMGICFDCLVEVDGEPNQQACMTVVRDGMRVARQIGAGDIAPPPDAPAGAGR